MSLILFQDYEIWYSLFMYMWSCISAFYVIWIGPVACALSVQLLLLAHELSVRLLLLERELSVWLWLLARDLSMRLRYDSTRVVLADSRYCYYWHVNCSGNWYYWNMSCPCSVWIRIHPPRDTLSCFTFNGVHAVWWKLASVCFGYCISSLLANSLDLYMILLYLFSICYLRGVYIPLYISSLYATLLDKMRYGTNLLYMWIHVTWLA